MKKEYLMKLKQKIKKLKSKEVAKTVNSTSLEKIGTEDKDK